MDTFQNRGSPQCNQAEREQHFEQMTAEFRQLCRRAYWEGVAAAQRGIREAQNPYPQYSGGAYFWWMGYTGPN